MYHCIDIREGHVNAWTPSAARLTRHFQCEQRTSQLERDERLTTAGGASARL